MKPRDSPKKPAMDSSPATEADLREALRQSEESCHNIFNTIRQAIYIQDEEGRFLEVNDGACAMYGYTHEEFIGRTLEFLAAPGLNDFMYIAEQFRRAFAGEPRQMEFWGRRKEGELFPNDVRLYKGTYSGKNVLIVVATDITGQKRTEKVLRESEELFREVFNKASDAMFLHELTSDSPGQYLLVNDVALTRLGYSRKEFLTMSPRDIVTEEIRKNVIPVVMETLRKSGHATFESVHRRKDGSTYPVEVSTHEFLLGKKHVALSICRDITRRKQDESALSESEDRYSALFSHNHSVSLIIDPDTAMIVDANDAAARYYGYSREKLLTMGIPDLNRLPRETVVRNLVRAKHENEKHFNSTHYRADGKKRYVEVYSGPIRIRGKLLFYSIIHDITESRQAVLALRESEERYRTLIDQLPDYVIVHRNGILLYINNRAAASTGYDAKALIGRSISDFIAPEHHKKVRQAVVRRMAGEELPPYEMRITAKDGTRRTVLVHGAPFIYEGQPASLNVLTDITLIKQAEEKIQLANEELEKRVTERTEALVRVNQQLSSEITARTRADQEITKSLEEKDLLLREIHHRVKNNLQIIASLLKLQSRHITDPNVLEAIQSSQSRIRAMALVHERIYRSHKISEINLRDYLNYLTRQIFQFYNIQQHQIGITVTMGEVMADIDTITPLGLIINELVSNSLKYAFPGGRKGMITIECTPLDAGTLRFMYHDNGVGIPEGLDWKNTESLGLRLVTSLTDQLNGTIERGPGEGTTFIIEIHTIPGGKTE